MQKKRNTRSRVLDTLVVLFCLCGIVLNIRFFWRDLNRTLSKLNEEPIATITFKYKSAQRKFSDRVLWDRLQQESLVYNGDTIRTAELSEATIRFHTNGEIILLDNSLVQVFQDDTGTHIDFSQGDISVNTQGAGSSVTLASGGNRVEVSSGGVVTAQSQAEDQSFNLRVLEGNAAVDSAAGRRSVSAGSVFNLLGDGTASTVPAVTVIQPLPGQNILSTTRDEIPVVFSWQTVNFDGQGIRLEIAEDRGFSRVLRTYDMASGESSREVALPQGSCWWRVYPLPSGSGEEARTERQYRSSAASGKLNLLYAPPPQLITPAADYSYRYRTKLPAVRFLWGQQEKVAAYRLDVADNPRMQNPAVSRRVRESSIVISDLAAGTWYWQVTPLFPEDYQGSSSASAVSSFLIERSGSLEAPALYFPVSGGFVNIARDRGDTYFSWKTDPEAKNYTLRVSRDPQLNNPVINATVNDNRYLYSARQNLLRDGQYYWGVFLTDMEGNTSPLSEIRTFLALEGEIIQRTIFPPDNYMVAEARIPDIRFTWRTNLPFHSRLQISDRSDFTTIFYEEVLNATGVQGIQLPLGTYHWRIVAETGSESVNFTSGTKRFEVVPPLPATESAAPSRNRRVIVQENVPVEFEWAPVPRAEYYQVKIYAGRDREDLVYETPATEALSASVIMDDFPEGQFNWTVQAFVEESAQTSRRSGILASFDFNMKKLRPVELVHPLSGHTYDGVDAVLRPGTLRWSSQDTPSSSRLVLSSEPDPLSRGTTLLMDINNPDYEVPLIRLHEGIWFWTVYGETADGLDISARDPAWFRVMPIKPLPPTGNMRPEDQHVIGPGELREARSITFTWNEVEGANAYIFSLYQVREAQGEALPGMELLLESPPESGTSYVLEDLSFLDRGRFVWRVEAILEEDDGFVIQRGEPGESSFVIDLPQPPKPKTMNPGELYGSE